MSQALAIALYVIPLVEGYRGIDGDGGNSRGPYQISDAYLADVNRISGCNYTREDCYNPVLARRIVIIYLTHYGTRERLGHQPSTRDYCRIHVAGPDGWREHCSLAYWYKCKVYIYLAINELKAKEDETYFKQAIRNG